MLYFFLFYSFPQRLAVLATSVAGFRFLSPRIGYAACCAHAFYFCFNIFFFNTTKLINPTTQAAIIPLSILIVRHKSTPLTEEMQSPISDVSYFMLTIVLTIPKAKSRIPMMNIPISM
jgi:hypothetical protein